MKINGFYKGQGPRAGVLFVFMAGLLAIFPGCSGDADDSWALMGDWIEEAPVKGRTSIYFHRLNKLSREDESGSLEVYRYKIEENSIFLRTEGDETEDYGTELFFKQIDAHTFQVENLYPSIPENEPTFMIFKRN